MHYTIELIVDILTVVAGIVGIVGISITGLQYVNADNNKTKIARSRRHMYEIVIGFTAYTVMFIVANWILSS